MQPHVCTDATVVARLTVESHFARARIKKKERITLRTIGAVYRVEIHAFFAVIRWKHRR